MCEASGLNFGMATSSTLEMVQQRVLKRFSNFFVLNLIHLDPICRLAKFEAIQRRTSVLGGLRISVLCLANFTRPPTASHEVAGSQTLLVDFLGPY